MKRALMLMMVVVGGCTQGVNSPKLQEQAGQIEALTKNQGTLMNVVNYLWCAKVDKDTALQKSPDCPKPQEAPQTTPAQ